MDFTSATDDWVCDNMTPRLYQDKTRSCETISILALHHTSRGLIERRWQKIACDHRNSGPGASFAFRLEAPTGRTKFFRPLTALKLGFVSEAEFDRIVDPRKMVKPYVAAAPTNADAA